MTPEFSAEQLTNLAGEASYAKGYQLFRTEAVLDWQQIKHKVTAAVLDEQVYHVSLSITAKGIDSACNCPVSEGFDFCHHCVAVALSVQQSAEHSLTSTPEVVSIHSYLTGLSKQHLLGQLESVIQADTLLQRCFLRQAQIAAGTLDTAALRKQITQALPYRKISQRQKVRSYFQHACEELTDLGSCLSALPAEAAFKLCEYTLERLNQVLMRFDTLGYQNQCAELSCQQYSQQLLRQTWSDERLAEFLLEQLQKPREVFPDPLSILSSNSCLDLLVSKAHQQWRTRTSDRQLTDFLQSYAAEYSDSDLQIELISQVPNSTDTDAVLQLIQHNLQQLPGSNDEAEQHSYSEQLQSLFTALDKQSLDQQQQRLKQQLFAEFIDLQGNTQASAELHWELFTTQKTQAAFIDYQQAATKQGIALNQIIDKAEQYLLSCTQRSSKEGHQALAQSHEQLFEFYLASSQLHKARIIADQLKLSPAHLEALALQLLSSSPQQSLSYYQRILTEILQEASEPAYLYACELLQQLSEYAAEQPQYQPAASELLQRLLTDLRNQHLHKRQFMRLLDHHFSF